jgi:hypothetical protein
MGMGGGGQKQTTEETKEIKLPAWVEAASQGNYGLAEQVANRPYEANPYTTVAGLDPLAYAARKDTGLLDDYYKNYADATAGLKGILGYNPNQITAPDAVTSRSLAGTDLAPYMNPFISNVESNAIRAAGESGQRAQRDIALDAAKKGAFGGSRQAVQAAVQGAQTSKDIGDLSAKLRSEGFQQAQQAAVGDIQREYAAAVQNGNWDQAAQIANQDANLKAQHEKLLASQGLVSTADQAQAAVMNSIAQKLGVGQIFQDQAQRKADLKASKWQGKRDYPLEQLNIRLAALGMSPYGHTETGTSTTRSSGGGGGAGEMLGMGLTGLKFLAGLSDPKTKTNIEPVGKAGSTPMYAFDYKSDVAKAKRSGKPMPPKRVGPMASEVPSVKLKGNRKTKGRRVVDLTGMAA